MTRIIYNGATITEVPSGQTATLKCGGLMMETDVLVETRECDESHVIEVAELPTENVDENAVYKISKREFTAVAVKVEGYVYPDYSVVMGITPEYFIVQEMPTENLSPLGVYYVESENEIYLTQEGAVIKASEEMGVPVIGKILSSSQIDQNDQNGFYAVVGEVSTLYQYSSARAETIYLLLCDDVGQVIEVTNEYSSPEEGYVTCRRVATKPTEDILESVIWDSVAHFYYVEDENNLFIYQDGEWITLEYVLGISFNGAISSKTFATEEGIYVLASDGWSVYSVSEGNLVITENGTYDVTDKANVVVNTNTAAIVGVWKFNTYQQDDNGSYWLDTPMSEELEGTYAVNFTCVYDGRAVSATEFEYMNDDRRGGESIDFIDADGNYMVAAGSGGWPIVWCNDPSYSDHHMADTIDFGSEPQVVSAKFRELMSLIATQQESTVSDEVLDIIPSSEPQAFNDGVYYRSVACAAVPTQTLEVGAGASDVIYTPEKGKFFSSVTVKATDVSDPSTLHQLCGIYLKVLPKTEYKVGEWPNTDGAVLVCQYTDGTTAEKVTNDAENFNLNDLMFDFHADSAGIFPVTVKYTEGGVTSQTMFWITVTE